MKLRKCSWVCMSVMIGLSLMGCGKSLPVDEEASTNVEVDDQGEIKPEEGAKLLFWTSEVEYGEEVAKAFQEKYNVPVEVEKLGMGEIEKVSLTGPSGTAADIFMCSNDNFMQGMDAGLFLEFDDAIADRVKEKVNETGIKTVTKDDKLYGVPVSIETSCLFYNKDLVDTPAKTLEEILDISKTYNDTASNKYYFLHGMADVYKAFPMLSAYGYKPFGENGTDAEHPGFTT